MATLKYNVDCCVGCGNCADVCPVSVWEMESGKAVMAKPDECVECGACVEGCPENCISLDQSDRRR